MKTGPNTKVLAGFLFGLVATAASPSAATLTITPAVITNDYVGKLTHADKKDQECGSCHGDAFEVKIIEKLWGIPKG